MLKKRLIPKLQLKRVSMGQELMSVLVTTLRYDYPVRIGDPVSQARVYQAQAADELIFLDLDATVEQRGPVVDVIRQTARNVFMPFTVGGGVRSLDDFRTLLSNGADKISVNSAAAAEPDLIDRAAKAFGAQCVLLSIDYRREDDGQYRVWTRGGTKRTDLDPVDWAREGESRGAGEVLLTSIDRDGTREGLDLGLTSAVADSLSIPVITSGGCGLAAHFIDGFLEGGADAVAAGTFFCFKDENPMQARAQIRNAGVPIRIHR